MKLLIAVAASIATGGFLLGVPIYMAGRILCPEVGIPVPPFGACFWTAFWFVLFGVVGVAIAELVKEV